MIYFKNLSTKSKCHRHKCANSSTSHFALIICFEIRSQGKTSDGVQNASLSPSLSHNTKQAVSNSTSPKSNVIQTNDLNDVTTSIPQTNTKSTTSPLSSCSNSPSSVRINQNYDPNSVKMSITNESNQNVADGDCDLDNSEDADSKPLLNATENTQIVTKRSNGRYDVADQDSDRKTESDTENDTLIANSQH